MAILASGAAPALAADGGSGGTPGGNWGSAGSLDLKYMFYDAAQPPAQSGQLPSAPQGWGQDSVSWFMDKAGLTGTPMAGQFALSCNQALTEATQRASDAGYPNASSRVVGIMYAVADGRNGGLAARSSQWFYNAVDEWEGQGRPGLYYNSVDAGSKISELADAGVFKTSHLENNGNAYGTPYVSTVCVALNSYEPTGIEAPPTYPLTLTTDHASVVTEAGSTAPVTDVIHASNGGSDIAENVNADVILNYEGPEGSKSVTKQVSITNSGDTRTPEFTPADFGWSSWPATGEGKSFWFDVRASKQGMMAEAVDTPDREARESWTVAPKKPVKTIVNGKTGDVLGDSDVLVSGMFYDARITAHTNGYTSAMTITDTVHTEDVVIGGKDADDTSAVQVLDPSGTPVAADVTVTRAGGDTVVSATVSDITNQGEYTLVVPTYTKPTGADYSIPDDSKVCYTADGTACLTGDSKVTRKVTPTPDKVWTLDESGALVAADPQHTNQEAADQKVFLPGDAVSAVVNDHVAAGLQYDLEQYSITDDWSDGLSYVTMPGAKVYFQGADVTSMFDISVDTDKGVTVATAKPEFLAKTGGLAEPGEVKLVVTGQFRDDYETKGETVSMVNKGSVTWNNETKATNEPPVFTWTPDPHKQVVGSGEQDGDKTFEDINGLSVLPGQKVEYTVQLDLNVPDNQARGITSLAVRDDFDPLLQADPKSIEVYDSRTNRPVPAKSYTLNLDEASHSFTLTFTDQFIKDNTSVDAFGAVNWNDNATFVMRFTGTVKDEAEDGVTVRNQAFQIVNGAEFRTEVPEVRIPPITPDKEDLSTDNVDIDGKTVVQGDIIRYRLTLDAVPSEELAYTVHKLGMVDDYDEAYLDVSPEAVSVVGKTSGTDVTDKFNIQVKDGQLYVFAKQVDWTNSWGQLIAGDPQPEDLAAYDAAPIVQGETPVIDQSLLSEDYYVIIDATVTQETDGYTIVNQARENFENVPRMTKIVSNPLKDIDPAKDVVIDESTKDSSINSQEVAMGSVFNYRLRSSEIPADRAYGVSDWSVSDTFDATHDSYTGIWAVYADTDVYDGDTLVFKAGDLLSDSAGHEGETYGPLFEATWDAENHTLVVTATDAYEKLVNTRGDLAHSWSVYTKMERIAPGDKIVNTVDETYNGTDRHSNEVWTHTSEHPAIDVEKYTLDEGLEAGDRDTLDQALALTSLTEQARAAREAESVDTDATATATESAEPVAELTTDAEADASDDAQPAAHEAVQVGFQVTNTGDVDLKNVTLTDITHEGATGTVTGITCEVPSDQALADETTEALTNGSQSETITVTGDKIGLLKVGQTVSCVGTLTGVEVASVHSDTATVTGVSVFTDTEVTDSDDWHARLASTPSVDVEKYTTLQGWEQGAKGDHDTGEDQLALTADGTLASEDVDADLDLPEAVTDLVPADGALVSFDVTNTGDTGLTGVVLDDTSWEYTTGTVSGFTVIDADGNVVDATLNDNGDIVIGDLAVGQKVTVIGILRGVEAGTAHADTATVTGTSTDGTEVSDKDDFHASVPTTDNPTPQPPTPPAYSAEKGAVTGEAAGADTMWMAWLGGLLAALGLGGGTTWWVRRRKEAPVPVDVQ